MLLRLKRAIIVANIICAVISLGSAHVKASVLGIAVVLVREITVLDVHFMS